MSKLTYEPGTRYTNSEIYDEATTEVIHGWQVFVQKRPDGALTGRKSFVDHRGVLCGIEIAESQRERAKADTAPDALLALADLCEWLESVPHGSAPAASLAKARALLARAHGIRS